jgi:hypothetical protein
LRRGRKQGIDVLHDRHGALADERDRHRVGTQAVTRDAACGVGGVQEEARERAGGARVEEDKDGLHALLERAAKLMVKAGYSAYAVKIKVAGLPLGPQDYP